MSNQESTHEEKHVSIAYLLWGLGFVGICGLHRMYLGKYQYGMAMLFTFGLCGVWQLIDVAMINQAVQEANSELGLQVTAESKPTKARTDVASEPKVGSPSEEFDELDLELESIEETIKKLRD
jgi:TM2 domain-containing membrane protein YozV